MKRCFQWNIVHIHVRACNLVGGATFPSGNMVRPLSLDWIRIINYQQSKHQNRHDQTYMDSQFILCIEIGG